MPVDTSEATFQRDVIDRSYEVPVVVDFWAEWCGPCRSLGPVIEKAVDAREGQVELVKLDTDANQRLAAEYRIQSIPAVKAFKDGRVIDEFVGALPPAAVERFLDGLAPSEAERLVEAGGEQNLRRALELEPGRADATLELAKLLADRGDREEALSVLANVAGSFAAEGLAARLRLEADEALRQAFAALDAGDTERGLDLLIEAIAAAEPDKREDLRKAIVGVLDELGVEHPLARDSRRRLASALY
ncbi:thioredoxin [Candidatus Solirubrobacter pratensis]|uniref:thioredoxin n=1 Tax=Candidatus Solirubrobacter pratensis TaxID=1298857 RepID=UPI0004192FBA|nr:thioredoxin [Candidatus Solirubrobacter pratensis]